MSSAAHAGIQAAALAMYLCATRGRAPHDTPIDDADPGKEESVSRKTGRLLWARLFKTAFWPLQSPTEQEQDHIQELKAFCAVEDGKSLRERALFQRAWAEQFATGTVEDSATDANGFELKVGDMVRLLSAPETHCNSGMKTNSQAFITKLFSTTRAMVKDTTSGLSAYCNYQQLAKVFDPPSPNYSPSSPPPEEVE